MDNKLKIINYLGKNVGKSFTMRELSKATKIAYATFYRTIHKMKELVIIQAVGKSKTIKLDTSNSVIESYLIISSEEEKKEYLKKQPIINKITAELNTRNTVILFGSYAKGNEKETSDIDLLIINKKGKKDISFNKYEVLFKKKINPIFVTETEFIRMIREPEENVGKQALKNNIILKNPETFWGDVLSG